MTKDSPTPMGGGRTSPKKPGSPGPAATAAVLEEQRRELEKLRAELEAERARGLAERRRFAAQGRQLREAAERERQQLADHLRSKWEAQRFRELRQLQEEVQREREAEIRQLLRWKEAELRQLQQLLHRERDGVVRQARELQRQLAQELVNRGYCGRAGAPEVSAAQCRCRLQEVLAQLRWETDSEQAARIRHLQAALDVERQLFLKYILEHFRWQPALSGPPDPQALHSSEEPLPETTGSSRRGSTPACRLGSLDNLSAGVRIRSRSLDLVPAVRSSSPNDLLPTRASSLDSLTTARSLSLDSTLSCPKAFKSEARVSSTDTSILDSPSPPRPPMPPSLPPSAPRAPNDPRGGEGSRNQPCEALTPSELGLDYHEVVKQNSELAEALQVLARRCSALHKENLQLRRAGFQDPANEKVKRLKVKHAELTGLARRLEDRARKLQETNLRALSAPVPGESRADLELCQAFARQRAQDLAEQASALLAKDKQIEELRRECHLLQARVATSLGSASHPGGGAPGSQWLDIHDLDRLQRESQREVLRLQRQLTLQRGKVGHRAEAGGRSSPSQEARHQVQALELELGARRRECEELGAQAAAERLRGEEAAAQLQAALRQGAWLAEENARLQAQADWVRKVAAENSAVRGQLGRACQGSDAAGLLSEQLLQQAARGQGRQQQLQHDLQTALGDLQDPRKEMQALHGQPSHPLEQPRETAEASETPVGVSGRPKFHSRPENPAGSQLRVTGQPPPVCLSPVLEEPARLPQVSDRVPTDQPLDSRPQTKKTSSSKWSSPWEVESVWAAGPSLTLDMNTVLEMSDLDSMSPALEVRAPEAPATPKLKVFLAKYSYNPLEGPNEHPESELCLTAGDYVYVFGDMDEDGFYKGELEDGRQGLVPSNLVEQIPDSSLLGCLPPNCPHLSPTLLPAGQSESSKDNNLLLGQIGGSMDRGPSQKGPVGAKSEAAIDGLKATTNNSWLSSPSSMWEQSFSRPLLGDKRGFCEAPVQLHLQNLTARSADITWVNGSSRHPHVVYLNDQEQALTPSGVSCYSFRDLRPGASYQVRVEVRLPWDLLPVRWDTASSTITFNTPLAGPPDPPLDVLVEHDTSPGFLVVSWLPVTIDSAGSSNGVRVTGYAVYADGLRVAEVADATAGSTLLELSQLQVTPLCQKVSVRTMSLYGESLDSVPAQIPEDCFPWHPLLESPPFSYTCGTPSMCRVTFPMCCQKLALGSLGTKTGPYTPRSCGESQAMVLETSPEGPPKRQSPVFELSPKGASNKAQGPEEAWKDCREELPPQKGPQNHCRPLLPSSQSGVEENCPQPMRTSRSSAAGWSLLSPECEPRKALYQKKATLEKGFRSKQDAPRLSPPQQGSGQQYAANFCEILDEEEADLDPWYSHCGKQQRERRPLSRGHHALGSSRRYQLYQPSSVLGPALPSRVTKVSRDDPHQLGTEANTPARVFVALFDYDPLMMSASPKAAEEELTFQKGQLLRVWGDQNPHGFYYGGCNGRAGHIPGHLVAEVEGGAERTDNRWHLPGQRHLPSVAHLEDCEGLASPQGSFLLAQGNSRKPTLWTPRTMIAALDYDPRDGRAGGRAKGKLALRAGDLVTVYGPVDDKGFYYCELGGHRGLVPAHLLDDMSPHRE